MAAFSKIEKGEEIVGFRLNAGHRLDSRAMGRKYGREPGGGRGWGGERKVERVDLNFGLHTSMFGIAR